MTVTAPNSSCSNLSLFHVQLHIAAIVLKLLYVYHSIRSALVWKRDVYATHEWKARTISKDRVGTNGDCDVCIPPIASKCAGGIRVVLCDPDDEVRAALRAILEGDSLLTVVAESRDWATCEGDIEELVPELLIVRTGLVPLQWPIRMAEDAFAPLVIRLRKSYAIAGIPFPSGELQIPIDANAAHRALDRAVAEIYDRKAKQLLYLVGRYVEASKSAPAYESLITAEHDGQSMPIATDAIMAVIAARKCVTLHTASGRSMLREPIRQLAAKLDPTFFVRIHRSVIVNLHHIDYRSVTEKCSYIFLTDGSRYPVGRNYRQALTSVLHGAS